MLRPTGGNLGMRIDRENINLDVDNFFRPPRRYLIHFCLRRKIFPAARPCLDPRRAIFRKNGNSPPTNPF
ncbi:hypothetical protein [Psychromarinibacter halotolerans]|uniref:Uncharacterized protein n=1 Tax=Psychromarinibacter halotolerans TaxID=1775175 RepID=A0ABV7GRX5_9RHOB|nr:hypothetical protein [Psychromarinibacter halotolerans]MDF0596809.1 hypothetical protein [Psychromarinibacter halotolerans]